MKRKIIAALLGGCILSAAGLSAAFAAPARMLETGSSLLYPLMNLWVADYTKTHDAVKITTQSTGSGTGISEAVSGVAQIGASDAYMSDGQMQGKDMLNIPLAISAQQVNYNVPGLNNVHLKLSGPVLAGIYSGTIRYWDDKAIVGLNAAYASKLPHKEIIPVHRSDGSGDTFIFSQFLTFSTPSWKSGPGYGTTISWPAVPTAVGANGNTGMIVACKGAPYSIAYIGVSYIDETDKAGLGYALLQNRAGKFVAPTAETISAAASSLIRKTPKDERISLIFAPGAKSYPIINYEYAIVKPKQPDAGLAKELRIFLSWAVSPEGGNASRYLEAVHFIALPQSVVELSKEQIAKVQ